MHGTRPLAPRDARYHWAYLNSAACPASGAAVAFVQPFVSTEAANACMGHVTVGTHAVIIPDGARRPADQRFRDM
jgi:hypothetical protein